MAIDEKKFYLTRDSLAKIKKEYLELKKIRGLKIEQESSYFLHTRANNSEPSYFLEDINFLEAKIAELEKILKNAALIKRPQKKEQEKINLGATVSLQREDGKINEFIIVGTSEANPDEGKISFRSPLGKALLGRRVGDQVAAVSSKSMEYKVIKISYSN